MEWIAVAIGVLIALGAILSALIGAGWVLLQVVLFFKVLVDRLRNKEDDYYSKHIDQ